MGNAMQISKVKRKYIVIAYYFGTLFKKFYNYSVCNFKPFYNLKAIALQICKCLCVHKNNMNNFQKYILIDTFKTKLSLLSWPVKSK